MGTTYIGTPVEAYTMVRDWELEIANSGGMTGVRSYIEASGMASVTGATKTVVPKIGDAWSTVYSSLTCKRIRIKYLTDNDNCPRTFVCYYDDIQNIQLGETVGKDDLPRTITTTGELVSWEPSNNKWQWLSDNKECQQPLFRFCCTQEIIVTRTIKDMDKFNGYVWDCINHTNDTEIWGFPQGSVLFEGADFTEFRNRGGNKRWKVDLKFLARKVSGSIAVGSADWGWNTTMRDDTGEWDTGNLAATGEKLYSTKVFDNLFDSCGLGSDETLYQVMPEQ